MSKTGSIFARFRIKYKVEQLIDFGRRETAFNTVLLLPIRQVYFTPCASFSRHRVRFRDFALCIHGRFVSQKLDYSQLKGSDSEARTGTSKEDSCLKLENFNVYDFHVSLMSKFKSHFRRQDSDPSSLILSTRHQNYMSLIISNVKAKLL